MQLVLMESIVIFFFSYNLINTNPNKLKIAYNCNCTNTGFQGSKCQLEIDECLSNPCLNFGQCVNEINHHVCNCQNDFTGPVFFSFLFIFLF